jgi:peptidyl-tRNA hydrolase, PTH2 family
MSDEREAKQVIVIRRGLGMRRGKEIAQGAHASMKWLSDRIMHSPDGTRGVIAFYSPAEVAWLRGSFRKITCQVSSLEELTSLVEAASLASLNCKVITDNGLTEFAGVPTITAVAIGPNWDDEVDPVTKGLKLY